MREMIRSLRKSELLGLVLPFVQALAVHTISYIAALTKGTRGGQTRNLSKPLTVG